MTVRRKMNGLVLVLLGLFGVAVGVTLVVSDLIGDELTEISRYLIAVRGSVEDFHDAASAYESRLIGLVAKDPAAGRSVGTGALASSAEQLRAHFAQTQALISQAILDTQNSVDDRIALAEVHGRLVSLSGELERDLATGEAILRAWREGRADEARHLAAGFAIVDDALGEGIEEVRATTRELTASSLDSAGAGRRKVEILLVTLFGASAGVGLSLSTRFTSDLARRLRELLGSARSVAEGRLDAPVPVAGSDEIGALSSAFGAMLERLREQARVSELFGNFMDPRIVSHVLANGASGEHAERRVVTVMFADIAGFTSLSENFAAEVLVRLLNRVLGEAADTVSRHGGLVDKYIGDALMAFWMPPFSPGDSHAVNACLAALAQHTAMGSLDPELPAILGLRRNLPRIALRFGIASGEVLVGTVGAHHARSFTVIGDTVNFASRLTGVNKHYGTSALVSEETWKLARHGVEGREIDEIVVQGKSEPTRIYELLGPAGSLPGDVRERCERYAKALQRYRARDFAEAAHGFGACLALDGADGPARVLRDRALAFQAEPPPEDWGGVFYPPGK